MASPTLSTYVFHTSTPPLVNDTAIVAEGSVVKLKQVIPPGVVAAGNPASVIRDVNEEDERLWGWGKRLYVDLAKRYLHKGMEPVG